MVAAALVGVLIAAAGSQAETSTPIVACELEAIPFAALPNEQIKGAALIDRLGGRRLVFTRKQAAQFGINDLRFSYLIRADGSFVGSCAAHHPRWPATQWVPCRRYQPGSPDQARDVGVWRIAGDLLVLRRTGRSRENITDGFFALYERTGALAAKHMGGLHFCLQGPIKIE